MSNNQLTTDTKTKKGRRSFWIAMAGLGLVIVMIYVSRWDRDRARRAELGQLVKSSDAAGFNLLLVTLDTTRQDHLGCYGYKHARTPTIDALVSNGVRFDDAVTSVPLTLPSHATMLTGLYSPHHGVRDNGLYRLSPEHVTLTETLKAHGYDTAAFVACFVLDQRYGLDQGFDVYDFEVATSGYKKTNESMNERPANAVTDATIQWLSQRQESSASNPFFAWVHYFDPHMPWQSPIQNSSEFAGRPYDAEIAFVDTQLKRLLDELTRLKLRDRTLIALVSDHGEGLGEHGESAHGFLVYEATMRVAFILSCPTLFNGPHRVDDRVVGLVDLCPTLEDLLGIVPTTACDGQSLLKAGRNPDRAIYIETQTPLHQAACSPLHGLRRHRDKYILAPKPEYYNLRKDPDELENLYLSDPSELGDIEEQLFQLMGSFNTERKTDGSSQAMNTEEIKRLATLGYVHTGDRPPTSTNLPDPKAMMPRINQFNEALRLHEKGDTKAALPLIRQAMDGWDTFASGQRALAALQAKLNQVDEALRTLQRSVQANPQTLTFVLMADILIRQDRYAEADWALSKAQAFSPDDGRPLMVRGDLLARMGHHKKAIATYKEAIQLDEHRVRIPAEERILNVTKTMEASNSPQTPAESP